ncbi:protein kinase [Streptomyces sp. NPDC006923]|uniref:serine/threonine-protein kinase n=1 Tax=Streptomyces sp. NPDC006923 TaxID=3155355 RepID=UPI00340AD1F0
MQALGPDDPKAVGDYELTARLGEGGMGRVYQGRSPGGRLVAVKIARPELAADPGFRSRFRSEVVAARRVGGFHTAQVVDADPDADPPWMVTAYVPGRTLDGVIVEDGPMDGAELRALGAALAEALLTIHRCDLVHRDLKPSNIIMSDDGPRVLDFGIARALNETRLTSTNLVIGTPGFLAPEQIEGGTIGPACDIFALGAVLVHAAGGRAFGEGSHLGLMYRAVHDEPDLAAVPGSLRPLVAECLAKDPEGRPTAAQLLRALASAAGDPDSQVPPHTSSEAVTAPSPGVAPTAPATVQARRAPVEPPTQPPARTTALRAVTFGVPWTVRLPMLLFTLAVCCVLSLPLFLLDSNDELTGFAWFLLVPPLCLLPLVAALLTHTRSTVRLDTTDVTITRVSLRGTKKDRIPWEDIAALEATVGDGRIATLRLALFDNAPLPAGAVHDPVLGPTLYQGLPNRVVGVEPAGALSRPASSDPRAVARVVLDAVRHFAPETLLDEATTGAGTAPHSDGTGRAPASLEIILPVGRRLAAAVGWLLPAGFCGWIAYLIWSGNGPEDPAMFVIAVAASVAPFFCVARIVNGPTAHGYTVTFDAEGISVRSADKVGTGSRTQVIPWRDVSALSKTQGEAGFNFAIHVQVKQGMPLPIPQSGLVPKEPDRILLTIPVPLKMTEELQRSRIVAAVRQFAPGVHTDYL